MVWIVILCHTQQGTLSQHSGKICVDNLVMVYGNSAVIIRFNIGNYLWENTNGLEKIVNWITVIETKWKERWYNMYLLIMILI